MTRPRLDTNARPNIMLLVGEDTGYHHRCLGNDYAHTPHIDRLAAQGCRFTRGYTHAPVCAPSRSGLVTGRYPWTYGSHLMRCQCLHPPRLFTHELRDAGYHVNWFGKTDFNFEPPDDFADVRRGDWLDNPQPPPGPFLVYRNIGITHESCIWDNANHEKTGYAQRVADLPEADRHDPAAAPVPPYLPDVPDVRRDVARYFDMLALHDRVVGRALDWLEQTGQADNTIVIYMTDHGRGLPREKRWCYEAGLHLPPIIRWPGRIDTGSVRDDLVAWVDIAPTILSLCGLPIPAGYQGRVFLGPDRAAGERPHVLAGRDRMDEAFDRVRTLHDKRFHYIRNFFPQLPYMQRNAYMDQGPSARALRRARADGTLTPEQAPFMADHKPIEELYDVTADPHCVHNLAADPSHRDTLTRMRQTLERELTDMGDLGERDETELIERGIVADQLDSDFRTRVGPLPERYAIGKGDTVVTRDEALARYGPSPTPVS